MDASAVIGGLVDVSTQVVEAVVTDAAGDVEGARSPDDERAQALARAGAELLSTVEAIRSGESVERVQVDLERGSLVALTDGERMIVATTVPEPTSALVAYDLGAVLRRLRDGR